MMLIAMLLWVQAQYAPLACEVYISRAVQNGVCYTAHATVNFSASNIWVIREKR